MKFRDHDRSFDRLVRTRVDAYFRETGRSRYADRAYWLKVAVMAGATLACYGLVVSDRLAGLPLLLAAIGFGVCSILTAFNLAHDAAHNALLPSRRWNAWIYGLSFNLQGANAALWKLRHIGSHHVFPNVHGGDADLDDNGLLRVAPDMPYRWYYRYQHWYAPFLYMLFSLHWIFVYDIQFLFKKDLANLRDIRHSRAEVASLVLAKGVYLTITLAIPIARLSVPWWHVPVGFLLMHGVVSTVFVYSLICTHFAEEAVFPEVDSRGRVAGSWATHQLATSLDYSPESRLANVLLGGFNCHAAHHLFPDVCHIHYVAISRIIRATAEEVGVRYNALSYPAALRSHFRFLRRMGRPPGAEVGSVPQPVPPPARRLGVHRRGSEPARPLS